jgi:LuxR family maltose regulon positive regulatory protein
VSGVIPLHRRKSARGPAAEGQGPPIPVIATKVVPPPSRAGRLARERLESLIAEASERSLTVLRAPGGFGKTTLALAWVEHLVARGDAVAWLSIDADDDEPRRFLYYVIHALNRACPEVGKESLAIANTAALGQLQAMLVNEVADCGDDVFLFLDDYNAVTNDAIHEFVSFLLRHAPANLHLVLLSRTEPPLELGSLRARGELLEIDASRLRFTRDETSEFLGRVAPSGLGIAEVRAIHGLTEGWPAALRITALSFEGGRDPEELLRALTRSPRSIGGFLDELCARLPPDLLDFLRDTSIVDRLSVALCDSITLRSDGEALLTRLERQQLVAPLDPEHTVFACHQLFREYLLQRLAARPPAEVAALHRRASAWYEAHGFEPEAVKHLLAAGDTRAALVRITDCAGRMVESGDLLTLLNWEQQLRAQSIEQPLALQLSIIWAEALTLSDAQAQQHIAAVERAVEGRDDAAALAVRRECLALRATACALADDTVRALELVQRYGPQPTDPPLVRDSARNVERFAHARAARWREFYAVPRVGLGDPSPHVLPATYEADLRALAEMIQARTPAAEVLFRQSLEIGSRVARFAGATSMALGPYAELLYETGREAQADALLREDIDLVANGVTLDSVLRGLLTAARLAWRRGQREQAAGLLDRAEAIGLTRDWPRLVAGALLLRLRMLLAQGNGLSALALAKRLEQLPHSSHASPARGFEGVEHYRAMASALVDLDAGRSRQAVSALAPRYEDAVACGAHLLAIRLGALLARAHWRARARAHATRILDEVIDLAAPGAIVGSIADEGPEILQLLDLSPAGSTGEQDARDRFIARLRATAEAAWGDARSPEQARRDLVPPLSPREREILELIAEGQSNKSIARQLGLGPETVKTHIRNVFHKLDVDRRTRAVLRAEELGLVRIRRALR